MSHINNLHNGYAAQLEELFDKTPKSVIAAIAVSALTIGGDQLEIAKERFSEEWEVLYMNGIVPQKPCKEARAVIANKAA